MALMRPIPFLRRAAAAAAVLSLVAGCGGGGDGGAGPSNSVIRLAMITNGNDLDPDGYDLVVGTRAAQPVLSNAVYYITNLTGASVSLQINGIAANCTVSGANPRSVTLSRGDTTSAIIQVDCISLLGKIKLESVASGVDPDVNGYIISLNNQVLGRMPPTGSAFIDSLPAGTYSLGISDVSSNCTLSGLATRSVVVPFNGAPVESLKVACTVLPIQVGFPFTDPAADTVTPAPNNAPKAIDVLGLTGTYTATDLTMVIRFAGAVQGADANAANSATGWIEIDADEDATTGFPAFINYFGGNSSLGIDYFIDLFTANAGQMYAYFGLVDDNTGFLSDSVLIPAVFSGDSLKLVLPMSATSGDGKFKFAVLVGTTDRPTDLVPSLGSLAARPPGPLALFSPERMSAPLRVSDGAGARLRSAAGWRMAQRRSRLWGTAARSPMGTLRR